MADRPTMPLLIDENVPASVADFFERRGHTIELVTKLLGASTPDPVIVKIADERSLVIVTWNRKHFNRHTGRKKGGAPTFTRFGLITFDCPESMGVERVTAEIEMIELCYVTRTRAGAQFIVEVQRAALRLPT